MSTHKQGAKTFLGRAAKPLTNFIENATVNAVAFGESVKNLDLKVGSDISESYGEKDLIQMWKHT